MKIPFRSGTEIMLALTEALGEIAVEITVLEQIGSKTEWIKPSGETNFAEEIIKALPA